MVREGCPVFRLSALRELAAHNSSVTVIGHRRWWRAVATPNTTPNGAGATRCSAGSLYWVGGSRSWFRFGTTMTQAEHDRLGDAYPYDPRESETVS